jgi:hypothetical protein
MSKDLKPEGGRDLLVRVGSILFPRDQRYQPTEFWVVAKCDDHGLTIKRVESEVQKTLTWPQFHQEGWERQVPWPRLRERDPYVEVGAILRKRKDGSLYRAMEVSDSGIVIQHRGEAGKLDGVQRTISWDEYWVHYDLVFP